MTAPEASDRLSSLPLFPLGTVLYPDGMMPLRIFEVRYLDMISRCHKVGAPFGVVSLVKGQEVRRPGAGSEAFSTVGTIATIERLQSPTAGLLLIRCRGGSRFRVESSSMLRHGLWIADVQRIDPDPPVPVPDDLQPVAQALARLIDALRQRRMPQDEMPLLAPYRLDDCGWVANRWCELVPMPVELKQRLMELSSPLVRLELIGDLLERQGIVKRAGDDDPADDVPANEAKP